jgi:glutathione reductase (NADPH)
MAGYDYDLFVIGAGSGGVRAARLAAATGAKVAVAEQDQVGGTCVIRGCVPKKFMVYASEFSHVFHTAEGFGWTMPRGDVAPQFSWPTFLARKDQEIARLSGIYQTNLAKAGAELIMDRARLVDAQRIELVGQDRSVTADKILIATGGRVWLPRELPGIEHAISSNEAFHLERLPKSIVIVGGGYIAVEFAGIFNGLGVDTTLIYRGANILRGFDEDVRVHLAEEMQKQGVKFVFNQYHQSLEKTPNGIVSHMQDGLDITTDAVMFAVGREPYVEGLGLEAAGVALNARGAIAVDAFSKTSADNIYAIGDVTDRINLTPVAIREAAAFVDTVYRATPSSFDHETVATAVFSQPSVGTVGLSEDQARQQYGALDIYLARFRSMKYTFTGDQDRMLMKLVVVTETQKIVGCHIVGPEAGEMIQLAAIAIKMGVTKAQWDQTCAVHPTAAEELVTMRDKQAPLDAARRA